VAITSYSKGEFVMFRIVTPTVVILALSMLATWAAMPLSPVSSSPESQTPTNVFPEDGNAGIGTTEPQTKLHVVGDRIRVENQGKLLDMRADGDGVDLSASNAPLFLNSTSGSVYIHSRSRAEDNKVLINPFAGEGGNVGIGTADPRANLDVVGYSRLGTGIADSWFPYSGDGWAYVSGKGIVFRSDEASGYADYMRITESGNVGIGTSNPQHKLSVKGTVQSTEVIVVAPEDFPDFVFKDGYQPMTLAELEGYIKQHGHLPGIPSAEEVGEKGLHVGEMQAELLQKIEELTLYVIDLKEENDALKSRLKALEISTENVQP
jgi:hypothetical protein